MANASCEIVLLEFLANLIQTSETIREFFLSDDAGIRCGTYVPEPVPNLFILFDMSEFPVEIVGRGQAYYQYSVNIEVHGVDEMKVRMLARTISSLHTTGFESERRIFTSQIDGINSRYSIAPLVLESSQSDVTKLQGRNIIIVSQTYSTELFEVR